MTESVLAHPEVACAETPPDCDVDLRIRRMEYRVKKRNAMQPEFLQAFSEVCESLRHFLRQNPQYISALEVIAEPERVVTFRVPWFDDKGSLVCPTRSTQLPLCSAFEQLCKQRGTAQ